jgi:hypothetical protein
MSQLAKLNLKNFTPSPTHNVEEMRRQKLMKAVEEQLSVADAALRGELYSVSVPKWTTDASGARSPITRQRVVRAWFIAQDDGFYVQCRYANKPLMLNKEANSIFVKTLPDVKTALQALYKAAAGGELDAELGRLAARRSKQLKEQIIVQS